MKKYYILNQFCLLFILLAFGVISLKAQVSGYTFSTSAGAYTTLAGGTILIDGTAATDDWVSSAITIPAFLYNGSSYNTAYVSSNGFISLGSSPGSTIYNGISTSLFPGITICAFSADLIAANINAASDIRWQIVGSEVVFQWKQWRRYSNVESFDMQVRLNTANGEIKFVYQLNTGPDATNSCQPEVGIRSTSSDYKNIKIASGAETWAAPLAGTANNDICRFTSIAVAKYFTNGQTYIWAPIAGCSGTPLSGTANASPVSGCPGFLTTLSLSAGSSGSGFSYQWQSSSLIGGPYSDIAGATSMIYLATVSGNTYYRCKTTCSVSGLFAFSTPIFVSTVTSCLNDLPCNAQTILIGDLTLGDNSCSSGIGEPATPACWSSPGNINTVWYKFQAPASGNVKIKTTLGTLTNTSIALYSGTCGAGLVQITCSEDVSCGWNDYFYSEVSATGLLSGNWYYISVDGFQDLVGTFMIATIDGTTWPPVPGQDCMASVPACNTTFKVENPGYQAIGNICDFTGAPSCLNSGEKGSVWYEITTLNAGNLMFTIEPNDVLPAGPGLLTYYGTDYDWAIYKKTGPGAVTCAQILAGSVAPLACNFDGYGVTGLNTGGDGPLSNSYTGHSYPPLSFNGAFEPPLAVTAGTTYWLIITNYNNSLSGFSINLTSSTNTFNFAAPNPLIWTGGASNTDWFDPRNWGNCSVIPSSTIDIIVAPSSANQPVIAASGAACKSITISSGASLKINAGFGLDVWGNYNNQGTLNAATTSDITIRGTLPQTLDGVMVSTSSFGNLTINKTAGSVTLNQHMDCKGNFTTITPGILFYENANQINFAGNMNLANNSLSNVSGNGYVRIYGSNAQTINQGSGNVFMNFFVDKTAGDITLLSDMNVKYDFKLIWGKINTNAFKVVYGQGGNSSNNINSHNQFSYINGNLRRYYYPAFGAAYNWCFPLGTSSFYALAEITNTTMSNPTYFDARYISPFVNGGAMDPAKALDVGIGPYSGVYGIWQIDPDNAPLGNYTIKLWFNGGVSGANPFGLLSDVFAPLKRPSSSTLAFDWTALGGTLNGVGTAGRNLAGGYAQRNNWSSFSHFGIGYSNSPLPIELIDFSVKCDESVAYISWITTSETNNNFFTIERSKDLNHFETVTIINGSGNSNTPIHYAYSDKDVKEGLSYYRIKQTDYNGSFKYFSPKSVNCALEVPANVFYYPNPFENELCITTHNLVATFATVDIFDMLGNIIKTQTYKDISSGDNYFKINLSELSAGSYFVRFRADGFSNISKVFKK